MLQVMLPDNTTSALRLREPDLHDGEYFEKLCAANPDLRLEQTAEGEILITAPAGGETGYRNNKIATQLDSWAESNGRGIAFDSSTGFVLPNGARRSPDAAWVERNRLQRLTREQKRGFLPLCPDFVIELQSPSDRSKDIDEKMREWMEQGAALGWWIDPDAQTVSIYRPQAGVETLRSLLNLEGEGPVAGFVLELQDIWKGLA